MDSMSLRLVNERPPLSARPGRLQERTALLRHKPPLGPTEAEAMRGEISLVSASV